MALQSVRLKSRQTVAEGTMAFHFDKPAGFEFKAGQAIDLVLPGLAASPDAPESRHAFSIVAAPFEGELVTATRMRDSAYKRVLRELPIGTEVAVDGPFGSLTLHKKAARAAVLIAGGIGITPFMSILRQAAYDHLQQDLLLLYSNRRPEDTAFLSELQQLQRDNPRFRLLATMTDMGKSAQTWDGSTQMIDANFVRAAIAELNEPICYLSGPPGMVAAMRGVLTAAGVDEDDVRSEEFYGY
ncbi:MAG: FAD-dependent oxidoreductase [Proteobacteria bacterium]|nr:FAD-dependent oxidoreductase [Pseudomonadota bacterium]MBS0464976.1 FAD-dependent oxidoreductase [Pseudomonadota bacterium]